MTEVFFYSRSKQLQIQTKAGSAHFVPSGALGIFKTTDEEMIKALRGDSEYGKVFSDKSDFLHKTEKRQGVNYIGLNPDGSPKMEAAQLDSNVINGVRISDHQPVLHTEQVSKDEQFREYINLSKKFKGKLTDEEKARLTELKNELKLE